MKIPHRHKLFFWLLLAAYSTFFAEVFAGSDLFPFFHPWGILVELPLYGLHLLILITLIYRYGKPRFPSLVFAGAIFGLYEAYMTKMLWRPTWEAHLIVADIAVVETFVLLWWHTWFSFITLLVLGEGLLTDSRDLLRGLPLRLRRFYGSWKGWLALATFGAISQSINSPSPLRSLLSGVGGVGVLVALTLLWKRTTREQHAAFADLLPGKRAFWAMVTLLAGMYVLLGVNLRPEQIPSIWPGQAIVWGMYAIIAALFVRALRRTLHIRAYKSRPPAFPSAEALLGVGTAFVVMLPLAKAALGSAAVPIILIGWLSGSAFETWAFLRAAWEVRPRWKRPYRPDIRWVEVGNGALALYHRPKGRDMAAFRKEGATHLVTLLSERENARKYGDAAKRHGITWVWLPMPNANYPTDEVHERLRAALPELSRLLDEGARIIIHCSAGIHRTGMVTYGLLRWKGYTPDEAMRIIRKTRKVTAKEMKAKRQKWGDDLVAARQSDSER